MRKIIIGVSVSAVLLFAAAFFAIRLSIPRDRVQLVLNGAQSSLEVNRVVVDNQAYFLIENLAEALNANYMSSEDALHLYFMPSIPVGASQGNDMESSENPEVPSDNGGFLATQNTTPVYLHGSTESSDVKTVVVNGELYVHLEGLAERFTFPVTITSDAIQASPTFAGDGKMDTRYYCNNYSRVPDLGNILGVPPIKIELEGANSRETYHYAIPALTDDLHDKFAQRLVEEGFMRDETVGVALDFHDTGSEDNFVYVNGSTYVSVAVDTNTADGWSVVIIRMAIL